MLDSESKFEKVQGIWFDDIDWGVDVSYSNAGSNEENIEENCVYISGRYAYGCKKVSGKVRAGSSEKEWTSFQLRVGKEKAKLQKNGWGLMIGKAGFVMGLIELVKGQENERSGNFEEKWGEWFEEGKEEDNCLDVTYRTDEERKQEREEEEYTYKKKNVNESWRMAKKVKYWVLLKRCLLMKKCELRKVLREKILRNCVRGIVVSGRQTILERMVQGLWKK
ncbi:hypothetical protein [Mycoplasma suis]|uniref:Uncharacterized protein n=1 Tax=Mycoplasma suis (strain Illinois) TaxID=768700 RepID=F0QRV7_MYCSL|nr:hypothetical protein MSU_0696 [Mycoplasma suis str. Illinois]